MLGFNFALMGTPPVTGAAPASLHANRPSRHGSYVCSMPGGTTSFAAHHRATASGDHEGTRFLSIRQRVLHLCSLRVSSSQGGERFNVSVVLEGIAADAVQTLIHINGVEWRRFAGARTSMQLSLGGGLLPPGDTVMPSMVHTIEATALLGGSAIATARQTILLDDRRRPMDPQVLGFAQCPPSRGRAAGPLDVPMAAGNPSARRRQCLRDGHDHRAGRRDRRQQPRRCVEHHIDVRPLSVHRCGSRSPLPCRFRFPPKPTKRAVIALRT